MTVTPNRTVRVPDDVWAHAQYAAQVEGTTVSAYIVKALRRWKPQAVVLNVGDRLPANAIPYIYTDEADFILGPQETP